MTSSYPGCGHCTEGGHHPPVGPAEATGPETASGGNRAGATGTRREAAPDLVPGEGPAHAPGAPRPAAPHAPGSAPSAADATEDPCDTRLVHAVADGDKDALSLLFARHAATLFAHLLNRGFPAPTVEDAVQESFLTVWKSASGFHEGSVPAWLRRIALCRAVDLERAASRHRALADRAREHTPASAATAPSAEECLLASSPRYAAIAVALAGLPGPQREVIELRYLRHLSVRETAERLAIPEGTVKARAARGCARLREWIVAQREAESSAGAPEEIAREAQPSRRPRVPRPRP
ncbi:RNA polymerase sigma factor [Streptomyces sp. NBC_01216]|uniref:RNA polymerase sigma factor n=1 Tax=unclassified Streptomyces TaxID=2593676 RepID=UPI002E157B03|nr:RNA polymerase sigma factor [Streptomyces sp. NBC_01216]